MNGLNRQIALAQQAWQNWPKSKQKAFAQAAATKAARDAQHGKAGAALMQGYTMQNGAVVAVKQKRPQL